MRIEWHSSQWLYDYPAPEDRKNGRAESRLNRTPIQKCYLYRLISYCPQGIGQLSHNALFWNNNVHPYTFLSQNGAVLAMGLVVHCGICLLPYRWHLTGISFQMNQYERTYFLSDLSIVDSSIYRMIIPIIVQIRRFLFHQTRITSINMLYKIDRCIHGLLEYIQ